MGALLTAAVVSLTMSAMPEARAQAVEGGTASGDAPAPFPDTTLDDWKERSFSGNTDYRLVEEDGVRTLRGHATGSASILYRETTIDLTTTPVLEWSWKVDRVFPMIDELTKAGDDYPARLYVVVRTGVLPWQTLALNYVWSSNENPGESWPNPFTDKAVMIPVHAGADDVGTWIHESRDVMADFRSAFGKEVDEIDGFAVMVDGDNGDREAMAWFGDIAFVPRQ